MKDFLTESVFFGVMLSLAAYGVGVFLKKKTKMGIFNPLLISIIITIIVLIVADIDYDIYYDGAKYISYLLTPATVSLAIPLYIQIEKLKKNWKAIIIGISSGVITSIFTIFGFSLMLHFNHKEYVTFLPKSITTAIGMGVSEELGGFTAVTVSVIILTGVIGNVIAELVFKIFRIKDPIARGIALGTSSHAIGTAKAMELGELEGAMSSLSIVVAGIITVAAAGVFSNLV
ncbi:MAG TPA: hypothetical protein DEO87_04995 [Lachnospiraceae bacterium]|jgi:predicted murein hydrolase (TIGR00659 family)|nr:hypothetical protein [Lachnospiraceae bacterium]